MPSSGTFSGNPNDFQFTNHGQPIPYLGDSYPYGTTAYTATHSQQFGTQEQVTSKDKILDHDNYFVFGGSVDQSYTHYSSTTTLGVLDPNFQNIFIGIPGSGALLQTQGNVGYSPVWVHSTSTYFGVFTLDTFNITKEFALTAGARYNVANIGLTDASGEAPDNNSSASYSRINPVVGLTYNVLPTALTIYGGYSEANRAPTPSENNCSNPQQPCLLENNLVSDPPLQAGRLTYDRRPARAGSSQFRRTTARSPTRSDISTSPTPTISSREASSIPDRVLRQRPGDLAAGRRGRPAIQQWPVQAYANYAYVNATYQFYASFSSPQNPYADANGNVYVRPGDNITGIPRNLVKLGTTYAVTPQFKVNAEGVFVGSQYYVGDPPTNFRSFQPIIS